MDWGAFFDGLANSEFITKVLAPLVGFVTVTGVIIAIIKFFLKKIKELERAKWELENQLSTINSEKDLIENTIEQSDEVITKYHRARKIARGEELSLWGRPPGNRLPDYDERLRESIPIMLFANLKGGVAKTTLSANIAAYFAKQRNERVLVIDLDYQGSLSGLCLSQGQYVDFPSLADQLIDGSIEGAAAVNLARTVGPAAPTLEFIPAFYPLETTEFQIMFKWFLDDTDTDVRYNLASVLLSDEIQAKYDRIILDGPPRMTPALINALCASTHLFIPTVLDNLSAETVGSFAGKINRMRGAVIPRLNVAGIIGTMVPSTTLSNAAAAAADVAERRAREALGGHDYFMENAFLRRNQNIANTTDEGIAYLRQAGIQDLFDPIGAEIARRTEL